MANATQSTGFLLWLSSYCFGCIMQENINKKKQVTKYFILSSGETRELNLLKPLLDSNSVVARFFDILDLNYPGLEETKYAVQFLLCMNTIKKSEKQKLLRKHKSNKQKEKVCENKRKAYKFLDIRKEHLCNEN